MKRADGFKWDGETSVEVYRRPGGVATSPGWRSWLARLGQWSHESLVLFLGMAFAWTLWPDKIAELMLVGMALFAAGLLLERVLAMGANGHMYQLSWNGDGVAVTTHADTHHFGLDKLQSIVWEPVHWYGALSRRPIALGGNVRIALRDGGSLYVGAGFDLLRIRALAERLARDLALPMAEMWDDRPVLREPGQLDRAVTGRLRLIKRQWQRMPSYANWELKRNVWGAELSIGDGRWSKETLFEVLDHYGSWLVGIVFFDLFRLPFILWAGLFGVGHSGFLDVDAWEAIAHTLAILPVVWGMYRDHRPRRLLIDREAIRYEVNGEVVAAMPVAKLEQVRHETFPAHAVRLIADNQEIVIRHLPDPVDYEALADQLPHLLPRDGSVEAPEKPAS